MKCNKCGSEKEVIANIIYQRKDWSYGQRGQWCIRCIKDITAEKFGKDTYMQITQWYKIEPLKLPNGDSPWIPNEKVQA